VRTFSTTALCVKSADLEKEFREFKEFNGGLQREPAYFFQDKIRLRAKSGVVCSGAVASALP
jgi:hypothetical protein